MAVGVLVAFAAFVWFGLSRWAHIVRSRPFDATGNRPESRPGGG